MRYSAGESSIALAKACSVSKGVILRALSNAGIDRRTTSAACRRYHFDMRFFESIDTETKAYWLGFISADGSIESTYQWKHCLTLALARRDREHLVTFNQTLSSTYRIIDYTAGSQLSACSRVTLSSPELLSNLAEWGVVARKTYTLPWPSALPTGLVRHYLRGYFDGDGSFGHAPYKAHPTWTPRLSFSVLGNLPFLDGCQKFLHDVLGLNDTQRIFRRPGDRIAALTYGGRPQVSTLWHLLYSDATVYLARKREKLAPWVADTTSSGPSVTLL